MARQPSSASMTSRSPGSQLWQVDTGAVLPHDATTVVRDTPALPGASVVVRPLSGGEIQVGRQAGASTRSHLRTGLRRGGARDSGEGPKTRIVAGLWHGRQGEVKTGTGFRRCSSIERSIPRRSPAPPAPQSVRGRGGHGCARSLRRGWLACSPVSRSAWPGVVGVLAAAGVTDGHRFLHVLHGGTGVPAGVLLVVGGCHPHECADASGRPAAGR